MILDQATIDRLRDIRKHPQKTYFTRLDALLARVDNPQEETT